MPFRAQNRLNVLRLLDREGATSPPFAISLRQHLRDVGMEDGVYLETMRDLMRLGMIGRFQDRIYLTEEGRAALADRTGPHAA